MNEVYEYFKNLSESELSFWGSVAGSIISVIGALLVGLLAIIIERRNQKSNRQKQLIRNHGDRIIELEIFLNFYIQIQIKNERLLRGCAELKTIGHFMVTLPRPLETGFARQGDIITKQLINQVITFEMGTKLNNQLIEDFVQSYMEFRDLLMPYAVENKLDSLNKKTVKEQHEMLLSFAESAKTSVQESYERAIDLLALVHLYGEWATNKPPKKFKELSKLIFEKSMIDAKKIELRANYNEKEMFRTV